MEMNVLIRGNDAHIEEFTSKFPDLSFDTDKEYSASIDLDNYPFIFDFYIDDSPENLESYIDYSGLIMLNSVKSSLIEYSNYLGHRLNCTLAGFNGLPSFFNREILECTILDDNGKNRLKEASEFLGFKYILVADRVGMVTPRVVFMIINEAYFTVQEGTAKREDIDSAMKLGTNYPYGPFEWVQKIGISHVYELLDAIYLDTRDERYKICPLLKREYLQAT